MNQEHVISLKDLVSDTIAQVDRNTKSATDSITRNLHDADKKSTSSLSSIGSAFKTLAPLAMAAFAGIGIKSFVSDSIHAAEHVQTLTAMFSALTKSDALTTGLLQARQELAKLPVPIDQTDIAMKKLLASGIKTKDEMTKVGSQLAAVSAGTKSNLGEVAQVYEKIRNNGKLTGETLQQLMDRGIGAPIVKELSKIMKIGEHDIHAFVSKGKVSFETFQKALDATTSGAGTFAGVLDELALTAEGRSAIIANKGAAMGEKFGAAFLPIISGFQDLTSTVLDKMVPVVDAAAKGIVWLTNNFKDVLLWVSPLAAAWAGYTAAVVMSSVATKGYALITNMAAIKTGVMAAKTWLLNVAMNANPIGIVVGAVALLAAGFVVLWKKSETFRGVILGVWEVLKDFGSAVSDMFSNPLEGIKKMFSGIADFAKKQISPLMDMIAAIKEGRWMDAAKSAGKLVLNLSPVGMLASATSSVVEAMKPSFEKGFAKGKLTPEADSDNSKTSVSSIVDTNHESPHEPAKPLDLNPARAGNGGGGTEKNISIVIQKLWDKMEIHSETIDGSIEEFNRKFRIAFVDTMRDIEASYS